MANITVSVDASAAQALLSRAPGLLDYAIRGSLEDSASYFLARVKRYPPARPNQQYVRTGTLGRSWSARPLARTASGWEKLVGSNGFIAPYNRVVMDRTRQARIHQGRWIPVQTIAEQSESRVQQFVNARIRAALGGL